MCLRTESSLFLGHCSLFVEKTTYMYNLKTWDSAAPGGRMINNTHTTTPSHPQIQHGDTEINEINISLIVALKWKKGQITHVQKVSQNLLILKMLYTILKTWLYLWSLKHKEVSLHAAVSLSNIIACVSVCICSDSVYTCLYYISYRFNPSVWLLGKDFMSFPLAMTETSDMFQTFCSDLPLYWRPFLFKGKHHSSSEQRATPFLHRSRWTL